MADYVDFADVKIGDELIFLTRDNGFGGSGHSIERHGIVTSKTGQSVTLRVVGANPFAESVFRDGKYRDLGRTARIRHADWSSRAVRIATQAD